MFKFYYRKKITKSLTKILTNPKSYNLKPLKAFYHSQFQKPNNNKRSSNLGKIDINLICI